MKSFEVAGDVVFRRLGGRSILFSEPEQSLLELNDTAALIWCLVASGADAATIRREVTARGSDEPSAAQFIASTVTEWQRLGLLIETPLSPAPSREEGSALDRVLNLAGISVAIRFSGVSAASLCEPLLRGFHTGSPPASVRLDVIDHAARARILRDGKEIASCDRDEAAPILREQLIDLILMQANYELALHAASLVYDDRVLLLCGPPGAGKSNLAVALDNAGFSLFGDDLVLLDRAGCAAGVPFPATLKARAWRRIAKLRTEIDTTPTFRRGDGRRVRYLPLTGPRPASALPVRWIIFLERKAGSTVARLPLPPVEALGKLIGGAFTPDRRLTAAGFETLLQMLKNAECYRLIYSQAEDAAREIAAL